MVDIEAGLPLREAARHDGRRVLEHALLGPVSSERASRNDPFVSVPAASPERDVATRLEVVGPG